MFDSWGLALADLSVMPGYGLSAEAIAAIIHASFGNNAFSESPFSG